MFSEGFSEDAGQAPAAGGSGEQKEEFDIDFLLTQHLLKERQEHERLQQQAAVTYTPYTGVLPEQGSSNGARTPVIKSASQARIPTAQLDSIGQNTSQSGQPGLQLTTEGAGFFRPLQSTSNKVELDEEDDDIVIESVVAPASNAATTKNNAKGKQKEGMIDLTNASDGEDEEPELIIDDCPVCIGQIQTLALIMYSVQELQPPPPQVDRQGRPIQNAAQQQQPPPLPPLPVYIYRDVKQGSQESLRLITPKRKDVFGVVEQRMANIIGPALGDGYSGTGITKEPKRLWCEAYLIRRHERNPMMLQLHLLMFCPSSQVQAISDHLEQNAVFLQHPPTYSASRHHNAPYKNPHNPAAGTGAAGERRRMHLMSSLYSSIGHTQKAVKTSDVQKQQVEAVFKELKSGVDLEETEPDPLVTTRMYPHQKQALSFLLDREQPVYVPPADQRTSNRPNVVVFPWQSRYDMTNRRVGWKCLVTDQQLAGGDPPPQARGAILADDMGLGKTLVVIALVCATLKDAVDWTHEPLTREPHDVRLDPASKKKKIEGAANGASQQVNYGNLYGLGASSSTVSNLYNEAASSQHKMSNKSKAAKEKREKKREEMIAARFAKLVCRSRATLIVCPLSTVQNWESQFEEHTADPGVQLQNQSYQIDVPMPAGDDAETDAKDEPDSADLDVPSSSRSKPTVPTKRVSVYVYHGPSRCADARTLANHDVVITTYSTLGTEYSKQVRAEEKKEDEEEQAAEVARYAEDGIEFVDQQGQQQLGTPGPSDQAKFKPKKRTKTAAKRSLEEEAYVSPLQQIQWYRIVLDEAHIIKEHTTVQARAACELSASRRTVLSGTPLQNSLNDLFSLVRFLRLEPFIDRGVWTQYIGNPAKHGDPLGVSRLQLLMRHLALRRTKDTKDKEGKPILSLPPNNQTLVELPFDETERAFYTSHHQRYKHEFARLEETDSVMRNYVSILQELLRLRQICAHMALVRDSEDKEGGGDVVEVIKTKGLSKPRALQLLALMRDSGEGKCVECGYDLLPTGEAAADEAPLGEDEGAAGRPKKKVRKTGPKASASKPGSGASSVNVSNPGTDEDAPAPGAPGWTPPANTPSILTRCLHLFCPLCVDHKMRPGYFNDRNLKQDEMLECSVCKSALNGALDIMLIQKSEVEQATADAAADEAGAGKTRKARTLEHSTKTRALLSDVLPFSQANPASVNFARSVDEPFGQTIGFQPVRGEVVKSVVFSQWTSLLDRIGDELKAVNIKFARLDGTMNRDARSAAMSAFKNDPGVEILLVSLRAGGVGLNLTAGRRVYLMEPFWNPAVENQAVDRIHRLGQTMPVQTVRFVIEKSIEMNMLKIQKRKTELANMSLSQTLSKAELSKRRMEDLKTLLS